MESTSSGAEPIWHNRATSSTAQFGHVEVEHDKVELCARAMDIPSRPVAASRISMSYMASMRRSPARTTA
jgi:hypothetical protein